MGGDLTITNYAARSLAPLARATGDSGSTRRQGGYIQNTKIVYKLFIFTARKTFYFPICIQLCRTLLNGVFFPSSINLSEVFSVMKNKIDHLY